MCRISFDALVEIQVEAQEQGWATRWSSVDALRGQVADGPLIIRSFLRELWGAEVRTYRCLLLFRVASGGGAGGVTTIDLSPARFGSLERLDRDPDVRRALVGVFDLALGGISGVSKG